MTRAEFDLLVADVYARLLPLIPEDLQTHFDRIHLCIEDLATPEQIRDLSFPENVDPLEISGMHVGVPLTEASLVAPPLFPTQVYLFREALYDLTDFDGSPEAMEDLRDEIAITLLHEIGHFFGLDEADLERLGFD